MNNLKQLATGYLQYAYDFSDYCLISSQVDGAIAAQWVQGALDSEPQASDTNYVTGSPSYPYVPNATVFRCPTDFSKLDNAGQLQYRNRSYTLNGYLGNASHHIPPNNDILKSALKLSDLTSPGPSSIFMMLDEHENSINDSHFNFFLDFHAFNKQQWLDCPSGRHGNSTGLSFTDGHAEIHKWLASNVIPILEQNGVCVVDSFTTFIAPPGQADYMWCLNHVAAYQPAFTGQ
jgi:prepilin-type processing-associated H-X9-DG protein